MARAEFVIATNPEPDSTLPYLIRLPLGEAGVVLKARDTWPRTAKVAAVRDRTKTTSDQQFFERAGDGNRTRVLSLGS